MFPKRLSWYRWRINLMVGMGAGTLLLSRAAIPLALAVPPPPIFWNILAYSPDGNALACVTENMVKLWDVQTGKVKLAIEGHPDGAMSIAFSRRGKVVASGGVRCEGQDDDARFVGEIKLWDVDSGRLRRTLITQGDNVFSLAFSPDAKMLASGGGTLVRLWDPQTGKSKRTMKLQSGVCSVAFSPDGKMIAAACHPNLVQVWKARSGKLIRTLRSHQSGTEAVAFSPDGRFLASGGSGAERKTRALTGELKLWDARTGKLQRVLCSGAYLRPIAFSPDGKLVAGSHIGVYLWDVQTGKSIKTVGGESHVYGFTFSPDGQTLAIGHWVQSRKTIWEFQVQLWNWRTGKLLKTLNEGGP